MHDLVVIGGGPAGYAAALRASELGAGVALVEAGELGGTCVNRGCIATMVWLKAAELLRGVRSAGAFGVRASVEGVDPAAVAARKRAVAGEIREGMGAVLGGRGIEVVRGEAVLEGPGRVRAAGRVLEAGAVVIATGSRPDLPAVEGLGPAATPAEALLDMERVPASALVLGGGPWDVEMAGILRALGAEVHLAPGPEGLLPREDADTGQRVAKALFDQGVRVLPGTWPGRVEARGGRWGVFLTGPRAAEIEVEAVVVGARAPRTAGLGLEAAGVDLDGSGAVRVDGRLATSAPGVYAAGDVTGGRMLSHGATAMGRVAAENALGGSRTFPELRVPRGIWGLPEVGSVGLGEEEAEEEGIDVVLGEAAYTANGLAVARGETEGAVKIVADGCTGEILGVHIVGPGATELVGEAVLAMDLEATVAELARGIRLHPTFSEALVDAARAALGG